MPTQTQVNAINKLAMAGQQAGFTIDQMIELLNCGLSVEGLLELIMWRLDSSQGSAGTFPLRLGRPIRQTCDVAQ